MELCEDDGWSCVRMIGGSVWVYNEDMYATVCDEQFSLASDRLLFWPRS